MSSQEFKQLSAEITRLDRRIDNIPAGPPGPPGPPGGTTPPPAGSLAHTVVTGDTASGIASRNGITLAQLKKLNPGKPRSGNWSLIYPGEVFRVR